MVKLSVLVMMGAAGCTTDGLSYSEQYAVKDCEVYACGQNSPEVEGKLFWELSENYDYNDENVRITGFQVMKNGVLVDAKPDVLNGELLGRNLTGEIKYKGTQLTGAVFTLWDRERDRPYRVEVIRVGETPMWTTRGALTYEYELYYEGLYGGRDHLCNAAGEPNSHGTSNNFGAVFFDDDRVKTDRLVVEREPGWFTIGCAGSALAKLHLSGHTKAGSTIVGATTLLHQRTAYLKMLTADYCGNGRAWTVPNTPLHYRDEQGIISTVAPHENIEAHWTKDGAKCLNVPRLDVHPTAESRDAYGESILDELSDVRAGGCVLPPPCEATYDPMAPQSTVVSTNYSPP